MSPSARNTKWREFIEPHGYFRIEIPAHWQVEQSDTTFTMERQGRTWEGRRYLIHLSPPSDERATRYLWVSIQVQQFAATPQPIASDGSEPTDASFVRTYRIAQDQEWLSWIVGHVRMHINYHIFQFAGSAYKPAAVQVPPPLSSAERHRRLALVQRIIDSLEVLPPAPRGENRPRPWPTMA